MAMSEEEVEREAWRFILDGATSYVEDAIDEDDEFSKEEFEDILSRAMQIIEIHRRVRRLPLDG